MRVVGEAGDGAQGVEAALRLAPDVILMDLEMPVLDGFAATERIMAARPTPILVITSRANRSQVQTAFEAIRRGAVEVLAKPEDTEGWALMASALPTAIRAAAQARVPSVGAKARAATQAADVPRPAFAKASDLPSQVRYVAVGASTGGPSALRDLLAALPPAPPAAILIVQHIAAGFEEGLDRVARGRPRTGREDRHRRRVGDAGQGAHCPGWRPPVARPPAA